MNTPPAPGHKRRSLRIGRVIVIWAINTVALMLLAWILQGFSIESWSSGLALAAVLGLLNALVWPVLIRVALPFTVITLGFGVLLLNGVFVWLASNILADSVQISGLWTAIVVAIGLTLINNLVTLFLGIDDDDLYYREVIKRHARRSKDVAAPSRRSGGAVPGDRRARARRTRAGDAGRERADDGRLAAQRLSLDDRVGM